MTAVADRGNHREPGGDAGSLAAAIGLRPQGAGVFAADLDPGWSFGDHPHGGYLAAVLARAAAEGSGLDPVSVSAHFLRALKIEPVEVRTRAVKSGRTVSVMRVALVQDDRRCVDATVSLAALPEEPPTWTVATDLPANPPADAIDLSTTDAAKLFAPAKTCEVLLDPRSAGFIDGCVAEPRLRLWARPRDGRPDPLFALAAGDLTVPVTYNLGRFGWTPTVHFDACLRGAPAPGWLRLLVESKTVRGQWFDEDVSVFDSAGQLVCQARQLALISGES